MINWKAESLGAVADMTTDKISVNKLSIENYISTENMLPDRGGVAIASKLPTSGSINAFFPGDVLFSNIRTYFKKVGVYIMEYPTLLPRFLKYVKINSRSDENSQRFPSTEIEEKFQKKRVSREHYPEPFHPSRHSHGGAAQGSQ